MDRVIIHTDHFGAVVTSNKIEVTTGIEFDELKNGLYQGMTALKRLDGALGDLKQHRGITTEFSKYGLVIESDDSEIVHLVVAYNDRYYVSRDNTLKYTVGIKPIVEEQQERLAYSPWKIELNDENKKELGRRLDKTTMKPDQKKRIIDEVSRTHQTSIQGYCQELGVIVARELQFNQHWVFNLNRWIYKTDGKLLKDVLFIPESSDDSNKNRDELDNGHYQSVFFIQSLFLDDQTVWQILQHFINLLVIGFNNKYGINAGNWVDYTLGKPIVLEGQEKIKYKREIKEIVESTMSEYSKYYRTEYTFSNTSTSVYLTIKFKFNPDLQITLRDHPKSKSKESRKYRNYKTIVINQNKLDGLANSLRNVVNHHIENTKPLY